MVVTVVAQHLSGPSMSYLVFFHVKNTQAWVLKQTTLGEVNNFLASYFCKILPSPSQSDQILR